MSEHATLELTQPVAIIIAGVIIAAAIMFVNLHPAPPAVGAQPAPTPTNVQIRPPSAQDHRTGSPQATIVLVEYSDFQCPFCSLIHPTLKTIVESSNSTVAWVMREFPLTTIHPNAGPAANAAECIAEQLGDAGFWKFADTMFADQSKISPAYYAQLAKQLGADMTKYNSCFSSSKYQARINQDSAEAQSAGGNGTPFTVVINTKNGKAASVSGALPQPQIESVIKSVQ